MQNDTYYKDSSDAELPDMCSLLSALVRLMSCYVKEPSINHAMALVHLMKQIEKHPDLQNNQAAETAVKQAQVIWQEELLQVRAHSAFNSTYCRNKDGNIH